MVNTVQYLLYISIGIMNVTRWHAYWQGKFFLCMVAEAAMNIMFITGAY